jgi:hypothetical protein
MPSVAAAMAKELMKANTNPRILSLFVVEVALA